MDPSTSNAICSIARNVLSTWMNCSSWSLSQESGNAGIQLLLMGTRCSQCHNAAQLANILHHSIGSENHHHRGNKKGERKQKGEEIRDFQRLAQHFQWMLALGHAAQMSAWRIAALIRGRWMEMAAIKQRRAPPARLALTPSAYRDGKGC